MNHPELPGELVEHVADEVDAWPVASTQVVFDSPYIALTLDDIQDPSGAVHTRSVVRPNGAAAVVALDDAGRVLLVQQYRHPVGRRMVELPAGTFDVAGEQAEQTARRELAEEADVQASEWSHLLTSVMTPGYSSEVIEIFLATGLSPVPDDDRTEREAEEADMSQVWLPLDDAVAAVLEGRIGDAKTVAGLLAAHARRSGA